MAWGLWYGYSFYSYTSYFTMARLHDGIGRVGRGRRDERTDAITLDDELRHLG